MQVLCLPPTIFNLSMNAFAHPYLAFYVVFISLKTLFLLIIPTQIYNLDILCSHTEDHNCIHDICIVFFYPIFNNYFNHLLNLFHYLFFIYIYLFVLPTYLFFYLSPIIALIIFNVLYFFKCILCIHIWTLSKINIYMCVCIYIYIYIHIYICLYIYIYIHSHCTIVKHTSSNMQIS